jgi:hypothetical protein
MYGESSRFIKHISVDSTNTSFVPVNLYNVTMPLLSVGINPDDGLLIGAGYIHTHQEGFRKAPFAYQYQLMLSHSSSTSAFSVRYNGEWNKAVGNADLVMQANAYAPNNTQNFYGTGNESVLNKSGNYKTYYRARFNYYQVLSALRWNYNGRRANLTAVRVSSTTISMRVIMMAGISSNPVLCRLMTATVCRRINTPGYHFYLQPGFKEQQNYTYLGLHHFCTYSRLAGVNAASKSYGQATANLVL